MNSKKRRSLLTLLGLITGMAVWPCVELLLSYQGAFSAYLASFLALGTLSGMVAGGFFGSVDGILAQDFHKALQGIIGGSFWGLLSGLAGFGAGQAVLMILSRLILGEGSLPSLPMAAAARGLSWAVFGVLLSLMEGIRCRSLHLLLVGLFGGLLGGILGGAALEGLQVIFPGVMVARLFGFLILFTALGFFYSFFEWKLSWGILCLLNGPMKGREYLINQRRIRIGSDEFSDICLKDYDGVAQEHANLAVNRGQLWIEKMDDRAILQVNEEPLEEQELIYEDVLKIGSARFFLKVE